jgi:hypothetical protein
MVATYRRTREEGGLQKKEASMGEDLVVVYFPGDLQVGHHLPSTSSCSVKR